jgi:hypothetical protein
MATSTYCQNINRSSLWSAQPHYNIFRAHFARSAGNHHVKAILSVRQLNLPVICQPAAPTNRLDSRPRYLFFEVDLTRSAKLARNNATRRSTNAVRRPEVASAIRGRRVLKKMQRYGFNHIVLKWLTTLKGRLSALLVWPRRKRLVQNFS